MGAGQIILDNIITYIFDPAVLLVFSVGFLLFVWGLVEFISDPADTSKRDAGKKHMLWGIIGMVVMVSVGGIIALIDDTFDLGLRDTQSSGGIQRTGTPQTGFFPQDRFDQVNE